MTSTNGPASSDALPHQSMPNDGKKGAPDGVNSQAEGVTSDGSSQGNAYPNPHTDGDKGDRKKKGGFARGFMGHGGQSDIRYHGSGQLGDQDAKPGGNRDSGTRDG